MSRTLRLVANAFALMVSTGWALAAEDGPVITLTDGIVEPSRIELAAGEAVTLNVRNTGATPAEFESKRLRIEQIIAPGQSVTIELQPLPEGSYPFVEEFHETLDTAKGTIVVK